MGISYLEIYNEAGYDLLAPVIEARVVEDLPRVHIMEDEEGRLHMRNLSLHPVASEEEALNLVQPPTPPPSAMKSPSDTSQACMMIALMR